MSLPPFRLLLLLGLGWSHLLTAQESSEEATPSTATTPSAPSGDPDLPSPFDPGTLGAMIENPPFTRSVNPSDSLLLTGVAYIEGKPVVTIRDTDSKQSIVVSDQPNAQGWTLAEVPASSDIKRAQASISMGGEVVTLRYQEDALKEEDGESRPGRMSGPGRGGPGDGRPGRAGRGPSREDIERYQSLSSEAQQRFREAMSSNRERLMNATPEQRSAFVRSTFDRIAREDGQGRD